MLKMPDNASKGLKMAIEYTNKRDFVFYDALDYLAHNFQIHKVLYPGSYVHISPSLLFIESVYVDNYKKTKLSFQDPQLEDYIVKERRYKENPKIRFHLKDYRSNFGEKKNSFDLLLSLSAGFISVACEKYLKKGGLFLADNEHNDAARAHISNTFEFIGVFDRSKPIVLRTKALNSYFQTKKGKKLTLKMVEEVLTTSPSKMSYKFRQKAPYYLFRKK